MSGQNLHAVRLVFHNQELERLHTPERYDERDLEAVGRAIHENGTLTFSALDTGLYPASGAAVLGSSGYGHVWVRDNVYVALAQWEAGRPGAAAAVATALLTFFAKHRQRFLVSDEDLPLDSMRRPHVRFKGDTLDEVTGERWSHAQNDALGYCLWLCARLVHRGALPARPEWLDVLALAASYLRAIRYWEDQDSGHWEETRKLSASSIGVVVAGLREWAALLEDASIAPWAQGRPELLPSTRDSIERGTRALSLILPGECADPSPAMNRRYDAALLFLVYPLDVIQGSLRDLVLHDIRRFLQGRIGIRRYLGDSYWAPDYDSRLAAADLTRDYSDDVHLRDRLIEQVGDEAQWCIFDPILSAYYGRRFLAEGREEDRAAQTLYFNRSLAHITPEWRCPELYYQRAGQFVANPHTPLLWTQANLTLALAAMRATTRA